MSKTQLMKIVEEYFIGVLGVHRTECEMETAAREFRRLAAACDEKAAHMRRERLRRIGL